LHSLLEGIGFNINMEVDNPTVSGSVTFTLLSPSTNWGKIQFGDSGAIIHEHHIFTPDQSIHSHM
jgi:hypothetical protein